MTLFSFLLPIQITVALTAIIKYKKHKTKFVMLLCFLLCLIVVVESLGMYLLRKKISNVEVYNIYTFFEYNIIGAMYFYIINGKKNRFLMKCLIIVFNVVYFFSFVYNKLQYYTVTVGSIVVGVFLIMYLGELLQSNKILNYKKHLEFWVTVGFFIFYLASIPFSITLRFLPDRSLFVIQTSLIFIMNFCILFGLVWSKKTM